MANTYAASVFTIDTSTNIAGLIALKGSALALSDNICIKNGATLTIEQDLFCNDLCVGYAERPTTTVTRGILIVNDGVVITQQYNGRFTASAMAKVTINGTMHTIGTSTGAADQQYTTYHNSSGASYNGAIQINGAWWRRVRSLTGRVLDCGVTTNSTNVVISNGDPRRWVSRGDVISIINRNTGEVLVSNRFITSLVSATYITISGAAVTTTTDHSVYVTWSADHNIFELDETTGIISFGDGTPSAWNNNGGAIPPIGGEIKQPGILWRSSLDTQHAIAYLLAGTHVWNAITFVNMRSSTGSWGTHFYFIRKSEFTDVAMITTSTNAIAVHGSWSFYKARDITMNRCLSQWSHNYGIYFYISANCNVVDSVSWDSLGTGISSSYSKSISFNNIIAMNTCQSVGIYHEYGLNCEILNGYFYYTGGVGIQLQGCKNSRVLNSSGLRAYSYGLYLTNCHDSYAQNINIIQGYNGLYSQAGAGIFNSYRSIFDNITVTSDYVNSNTGILSIAPMEGSNIIIGCKSINFATDLTFNNPFNIDKMILNGRERVVGAASHTGAPGSIYSDYIISTGAATLRWRPGQISGLPDTWFGDGSYVYINTADEWYESLPSWCPGVLGFTSVSLGVGHGTSHITTQYRISNNFGKDWNAWKDFTTANVLTEITDSEALYLQIRCKRDNLIGGDNTAYIDYAYININADKYNPNVNYRKYLYTEHQDPAMGRMVS